MRCSIKLYLLVFVISCLSVEQGRAEGDDYHNIVRQRWSQWTVCSRRCGGGARSRVRDCQELGCNHGYGVQRQRCNVHPCRAPPRPLPPPPPPRPRPPPPRPHPIRRPRFRLGPGEIRHKNKIYKCSSHLATWHQAEAHCLNNYHGILAMPKDLYLINVLRKLCGFIPMPRPDSPNWWHDGVGKWEQFTYWIGVIDFQYLDHSNVPQHLYYPGEPSRHHPQTCTQANSKLDNEFCTFHRKFVCEKPAVPFHG